MFIENIKIENFRNIENLYIDNFKKINFFIGNNAEGKTNIVESIYFSSFLKSFRTSRISDLIKDGYLKSTININIIDNKVNNNIYVQFDNKIKNLKVNSKKPDNYKYINVIIFHPEETNYVTSYPMYRRNLIDRSIFYTDYNYINIYKKYFRCLSQRNSYLKNEKNFKDIWLEQLIYYGSIIIRKRLSYIDKINKYFSGDNFKKINLEKYFIKYSKNYDDFSSIEAFLNEEFSKKLNREKLLGYTLVGPHKDDINFLLNGRPAEAFASQGQKRSLIISFKTAQILDYKAVQGHYPVLILDDMTSELDNNRKNILLENLLENSGQVFITSTDFKTINSSEQTKVFRVNNGEISVAD